MPCRPAVAVLDPPLDRFSNKWLGPPRRGKFIIAPPHSLIEKPQELGVAFPKSGFCKDRSQWLEGLTNLVRDRGALERAAELTPTGHGTRIAGAP